MDEEFEDGGMVRARIEARTAKVMGSGLLIWKNGRWVNVDIIGGDGAE